MDMKICVLAGDGIGPEITEQAVRVLETVCTVKKISLTRTDALIGGAAIDAVGVPLPDETLAKCRSELWAVRNGMRSLQACARKRGFLEYARRLGCMRTCGLCRYSRRCAALRRCGMKQSGRALILWWCAN